ncbi:hypothetical protein AAHA92_03361 [Salvia divinorum]|uniref:Uncharacterized protein n=1 Tax=Salvia divinorum TaxID=28513 RepID=A0ABD1IGV0_SALDI
MTTYLNKSYKIKLGVTLRPKILTNKQPNSGKVDVYGGSPQTINYHFLRQTLQENCEESNVEKWRMIFENFGKRKRLSSDGGEC